MSSNAELARRVNEHFAATGEVMWDAYAEDMVFVSRGELVGRTDYHGHDGFRAALAEFGESWAEIRPKVTEVTEISEDVLVATIRFRLRAHSGVVVDADEFWATWIRDGKIVRVEQHGVREEAEAAARGG